MTSQELSNMVFAIKDKISDKEFKDLMDKLSVKNKEEKEEGLYIFEYIKQYNHKEYVNPDDIYSSENKQWINDLKYKKCKKIIKFESVIDGFVDKEKYIQNVIKWVDEGSDDVHFYFNKNNNNKNPNKHLYKILSTTCSDEYEISYFHNTDGEQDTMIRLRHIIPISLKPFKM